MTVEQYELIDFLEWAQHEGLVGFKESLKCDIVERYTESKNTNIVNENSVLGGVSKKEVSVLPQEKCDKCGKWCTGRSCNDCQRYW